MERITGIIQAVRQAEVVVQMKTVQRHVVNRVKTAIVQDITEIVHVVIVIQPQTIVVKQ